MPKASGREKSKERSDDDGDEEERRKVRACVSAGVLVACHLLLNNKAKACNRTRRAVKGHGEAFNKKRENASLDLSCRSTESSLSIEERRRRRFDEERKTSRWRSKVNENAWKNSQRPARDTVAPVRRGFVMALVCIVDEKVKGGVGALEAGEGMGRELD